MTSDELLALAKEVRPDIPWAVSEINGTSYVSLMITQDSPFGPVPMAVALLGVYGEHVGGIFASRLLPSGGRPTFTLNWRGGTMVWPFLTLPLAEARAAITSLTTYTDRLAHKLGTAALA